MSNSNVVTVPKAEYDEYTKNKAEYTSIFQKLGDLEINTAENKDVIETLSGMDSSRRCYRVVDSILVERNVAEVKEALEVEKQNMMTLMGQLNTRSRELEQKIMAFEVWDRFCIL